MVVLIVKNVRVNLFLIMLCMIGFSSGGKWRTLMQSISSYLTFLGNDLSLPTVSQRCRRGRACVCQ